MGNQQQKQRTVGGGPQDPNYVSLREYMEALLIQYEQGHHREHEALGLAVEKAELAVSRRLDGMNQFREQLERQAATFITKEESEAKRTALFATAEAEVKGVENRITILETLSANLQGRFWALGVGLTVVVVVVNLIVKFFV